MSEFASFEDLTGGEAVTEEVEISAGRVKVRGLSRYEYMLAAKTSSGDGSVDPGRFEAWVVSAGMVEPRLSSTQVEAWAKSPGSQVSIDIVMGAVMRLSGLREGADKSNV